MVFFSLSARRREPGVHDVHRGAVATGSGSFCSSGGPRAWIWSAKAGASDRGPARVRPASPSPARLPSYFRAAIFSLNSDKLAGLNFLPSRLDGFERLTHGPCCGRLDRDCGEPPSTMLTLHPFTLCFPPTLTHPHAHVQHPPLGTRRRLDIGHLLRLPPRTPHRHQIFADEFGRRTARCLPGGFPAPDGAGGETSLQAPP